MQRTTLALLLALGLFLGCGLPAPAVAAGEGCDPSAGWTPGQPCTPSDAIGVQIGTAAKTLQSAIDAGELGGDVAQGLIPSENFADLGTGDCPAVPGRMCRVPDSTVCPADGAQEAVDQAGEEPALCRYDLDGAGTPGWRASGGGAAFTPDADPAQDHSGFAAAVQAAEDQDASEVALTPPAGITGTDVQAGVDELAGRAGQNVTHVSTVADLESCIESADFTSVNETICRLTQNISVPLAGPGVDAQHTGAVGPDSPVWAKRLIIDGGGYTIHRPHSGIDVTDIWIMSVTFAQTHKDFDLRIKDLAIQGCQLCPDQGLSINLGTGGNAARVSLDNVRIGENSSLKDLSGSTSRKALLIQADGGKILTLAVNGSWLEGETTATEGIIDFSDADFGASSRLLVNNSVIFAEQGTESPCIQANGQRILAVGNSFPDCTDRNSTPYTLTLRGTAASGLDAESYLPFTGSAITAAAGIESTHRLDRGVAHRLRGATITLLGAEADASANCEVVLRDVTGAVDIWDVPVGAGNASMDAEGDQYTICEDSGSGSYCDEEVLEADYNAGNAFQVQLRELAAGECTEFSGGLQVDLAFEVR